MKLIYERSVPGRHCTMPAPCRAPQWTVPEKFRRADRPDLPEVSETELSRHYTELAKQTYGVNDGFYPLGSCTMKYNPAANETAAALEGFADVGLSLLAFAQDFFVRSTLVVYLGCDGCVDFLSFGHLCLCLFLNLLESSLIDLSHDGTDAKEQCHRKHNLFHTLKYLIMC